ncbi:SET-domain-containing protein [Mycena indigotica]|uniref:SET-domain-containing protein n=1 Tax=Mycena indigotica TaxID=2126181 RepID=A0A8H6SCI2_9AGAR|nr:SET-domain-containing protein [Mycena indigotica]KAF7295345.1 SET-domain-containing protein [Mycena indigotica]
MRAVFYGGYHQRDIPNVVWADGHDTASATRLPPRFGTASDELWDLESNAVIAKINMNRKKFCSNLNCVMHCCGIHISFDYQRFTPPFDRHREMLNVAKLRSRDLLDYKMEHNPEPCSTRCFVQLIPREEEEMFMDTDDSTDDSEDREFVSALLRLDPDMSPCDIATIAEVDCSKAFIIRQELISDHSIHIPRPSKRSKKAKRWLTPKSLKVLGTNDEDERQAYTKPCTHSGECHKSKARFGTSQCSCVMAGAHCERNCECPPTCKQRWTGCNVTCAKRKHCGSHRNLGKECVCRTAGRECDPELCTGCDARNFEAKGRGARHCENMDIQRGNFKSIVVRPGAYGFGAFAGENISKGDLIGDYPGELVFASVSDSEDQTPPTPDVKNDDQLPPHHRHTISKHFKANYVFGMGPILDVDAMSIGNGTRFLNDPKPQTGNCSPGEIVVNGQRYITIHADRAIPKGRELTLSYGEAFWAE